LSLATRTDPRLHPGIFIILQESLARIFLSGHSLLLELRRRTFGMAKKKKGKKKKR